VARLHGLANPGNMCYMDAPLFLLLVVFRGFTQRMILDVDLNLLDLANERRACPAQTVAAIQEYMRDTSARVLAGKPNITCTDVAEAINTCSSGGAAGDFRNSADDAARVLYTLFDIFNIGVLGTVQVGSEEPQERLFNLWRVDMNGVAANTTLESMTHFIEESQRDDGSVVETQTVYKPHSYHPLLVMHLDRIRVQDGRPELIATPVTVSESVGSQALFGIVVYNGGHYVAYFKHPDCATRQYAWYVYNDLSGVARVGATLQSVLDRRDYPPATQGVMFFYWDAATNPTASWAASATGAPSITPSPRASARTSRTPARTTPGMPADTTTPGTPADTTTPGTPAGTARTSRARTPGVTRTLDTIPYKRVAVEDNNTTAVGGPVPLAAASAGIVPVILHGHAPHFVLGYDPKMNTWKYFGGEREEQDQTPADTALREAREETVTLAGVEVLPFSRLEAALKRGNATAVPVGYQLYQRSKVNDLVNVFYFVPMQVADAARYVEGFDVSNIAGNEVSKVRAFPGEALLAWRAPEKLHAPMPAVIEAYLSAQPPRATPNGAQHMHALYQQIRDWASAKAPPGLDTIVPALKDFKRTLDGGIERASDASDESKRLSTRLGLLTGEVPPLEALAKVVNAPAIKSIQFIPENAVIRTKQVSRENAADMWGELEMLDRAMRQMPASFEAMDSVGDLLRDFEFALSRLEDTTAPNISFPGYMPPQARVQAMLPGMLGALAEFTRSIPVHSAPAATKARPVLPAIKGRAQGRPRGTLRVRWPEGVVGDAHKPRPKRKPK
jgi:hypothetical protein